MSQGARITLGVALIFIAGGFLAIAGFSKDFEARIVPVMAILGLFSGICAVACFSAASHPITIRIIAGTVFLLCLFYVINQVITFSSIQNELAATEVRSRPSLYNSICFFILVGLPSGYAAVKGHYPIWGHHSAAFTFNRSGETEA